MSRSPIVNLDTFFVGCHAFQITTIKLLSNWIISSFAAGVTCQK